jgi:glycosyltransferase involved in cell wall biosynthesis
MKKVDTIVIILDHASVTGGQAKVALESAVGLKIAGYNPIVFASVGPIDSRLTDAGVEVICLNQNDLLGHPSKLAAAAQGIWNRYAAMQLEKLLVRLPQKSTIVHVHGWAKAVSPSIAVPIRQSGLPAVYTMHDYFLLCANGGLYNYQKEKHCTLVPQSLKCCMTNCDSRCYQDKLWRLVRTAVMQHVARLNNIFSDVILITEFQKAIVAPHMRSTAKVHIVSNPIDAEDRGIKGDPASGSFLFVGRLSPEKGVFCFAEAARLANITPLFVGDGPAAEELRKRYINAKFLGWQTPARVKDLMRCARALVFPSLCYETQGLVTLEAMSLGTPSIVSDGCAARAAVEDGVTGVWFKNNDVVSLAEAIRKLMDADVVKRMSVAAYEHFWREGLTLERHVAALSRIYSSM